MLTGDVFQPGSFKNLEENTKIKKIILKKLQKWEILTLKKIVFRDTMYLN